MTQSRRTMPYAQVKRRLAAPGSTSADPGAVARSLEFSKSQFFREPLPPQSISELLDNLTRTPLAGQLRSLSFTPWGGAYNRVASDATAFVHRGESFLIEHVVQVPLDAAGAEQAAARAWLRRSWAGVRPWGSGGVYPNFPDLDLDNAPRAYWGRNCERLLEVKQKHDPDHWFRFPQHIGEQETRK